MSIQQEAAYLAYSFGWSAVRRMPEKTAYRNFARIGDRVWKRRGAGVVQLEKNIHRVVPDASPEQLQEMSREALQGYFRYWCDAFRMPDWTPKRINESFVCVDGDNLGDALALGGGAVIALPHMGNWDHTGAWGTLNYAPVSSIAEVLKPEKLFEKFLEYRESVGMTIYPLGQPGVVDALAENLRRDNIIVALVSDRDLTAHGIDVDFFGEPTRMPAGSAALALRTGAPLMTATLWYDGPKTCAQISDHIPFPDGAPVGDDAKNQPGYVEAITTMTQAIADNFAKGIAEHPTDWHMMQKLWLADLDQDKLAASDAAGGR